VIVKNLYSQYYFLQRTVLFPLNKSVFVLAQQLLILKIQILTTGVSMKPLQCIATGIALSALMFSASATNITIADGNVTQNNYYWDATWMAGTAEDNEVEPGCETGQNWDMEAFLLNGTTLTAVSGYDLKNGFDNTVAGDLFVDIGGSAGYDFVYDIDWMSGTYLLYQIDGSGTINKITMPVESIVNATSNPISYTAGVNQTVLKTGSLNYQSGIISGAALVTATGDADALTLAGAANWKGQTINNTHNIASFDVSRFAGEEATFHLTMSCGNDNLMGRAKVSVPEPGSASLLILGLLSLGGCFVSRRKKII
jgi:hypothetical protein